MHLSKRINWFSLFVFALLAAGQLFHATGQPSSGLTICGQLTDISGIDVGSASPEALNVTVKIYDQQTGGTALYSEDFNQAGGHAVSVDKGYFSVILGTVNSVDTLKNILSSHNNLWVEVIVDSDVLTRAPITGSPYVLLNSSITKQHAAK